MTRNEKGRVAALAAIGILMALILWGIIATIPTDDKETGEKKVILRAGMKESFTLDDMIRSIRQENPGKTSCSPEYDPKEMPSPDTVEKLDEIRRLQEIIRMNESELETGTDIQSPVPFTGKVARKEEIRTEQMATRDTARVLDSIPAEKPRRGFNSVRLVRQEEKNVIRAFVHSTQTVMTGSTLKMQLAENCLTDDGQRIRKGTPVFGEVTKIDGERVLVKITSINIGGNILPFSKEVYSEDALEGIYVPGNAKADVTKDASAAAVNGANANISGGFDMGSQLVAGAANSVISATKSAASKNIRKVKVTIKTNYRILLKETEK